MTEPAYGPIEEPPKRMRPPLDRVSLVEHGPAAGESREEWIARRRDDRFAAMREPLEGITLGAYDTLILWWLADWDIPTVATVASLLHRARAAEPLPEPLPEPPARGESTP